MTYLRCSTKISAYLSKQLNYSHEKSIILAYAIDSIVLSIAGFLFIMVIALLFGVVKETFFAALAGGILRKFSGGGHCSTAFRCLVMGAIIYPIIGILANLLFLYHQSFPGYYLLIIVSGVVCIIIVYLYAPVDSTAKPIISLTFRKKLRISSMLTVLIFCAISMATITSNISISIMGGLLFQAITLFPAFSN